MRGLAVLATGALLWGFAAGPASADSIRDGQWALQKYGAASSVWPISQGDGVVVAVIDSGVAEVPDLQGQVLVGADFPETNGQGRDDKEGHGTSMASDIAGHGHDGGQAGVMGLAPKVKILPIKVALPGGQESLNNVASAIHYAVDHGAKVINMSFGSATPLGGPSVERDAISYAINKDVVLVAAAGNSHGAAVDYPAAFPGVVAVSGIDQEGNYWDHSSGGPEVTLSAPAVGILHADPTMSTGYAKGDGTSESSAFVSAIAALVRSKYPELSAGQVINRIIQSAVAPPDKSTVPNDRYGYGIASPSKALQANPAVDNGPKDNPLLKRVESQAEPGSNSSGPASASAAAPTGNTAASKSSGGSKAMLFAVGGGVLVLVIIVIVVLVSRRSRNGGGGGGNGGNGGGPGGGYPYPPQGQPGPQGYQQQYPPQGYPQQQYPPQQQPPQPPQGNPYQR